MELDPYFSQMSATYITQALQAHPTGTSNGDITKPLSHQIKGNSMSRYRWSTQQMTMTWEATTPAEPMTFQFLKPIKLSELLCPITQCQKRVVFGRVLKSDTSALLSQTVGPTSTRTTLTMMLPKTRAGPTSAASSSDGYSLTLRRQQPTRLSMELSSSSPSLGRPKENLYQA